MKKPKEKAVASKESARLNSYKFDSSQFVKLSSYETKSHPVTSKSKETQVTSSQNLK